MYVMYVYNDSNDSSLYKRVDLHIAYFHWFELYHSNWYKQLFWRQLKFKYSFINLHICLIYVIVIHIFILSFKVGSALHEMLHVLGRSHEQTRTDRDQHIYINETKFSGANYGKKRTRDYYPYDYESVMHYPFVVSAGMLMISF